MTRARLLLAVAVALVALSVLLVLPGTGFMLGLLTAAATGLAWLRRHHIARYLVARRAERRRIAGDTRAGELAVQARRDWSRQQQAQREQKERSYQKRRDLNAWQREFYELKEATSEAPKRR